MRPKTYYIAASRYDKSTNGFVVRMLNTGFVDLEDAKAAALQFAEREGEDMRVFQLVGTSIAVRGAHWEDAPCSE